MRSVQPPTTNLRAQVGLPWQTIDITDLSSTHNNKEHEGKHFTCYKQARHPGV